MPTALNDLRGNPGHRPRRPGEPRPPSALPSPPKFLKGEARREWFRVSSWLYVVGLLSNLDRGALVAYCVAWGRLADAEEKLAKHGAVILSKTAGPIPSPYLRIAEKAAEQMMKAATEFGMTPSARTRVQGVAVKPMDPVAQARRDRFFGRDPGRKETGLERLRRMSLGDSARNPNAPDTGEQWMRENGF